MMERGTVWEAARLGAGVQDCMQKEKVWFRQGGTGEALFVRQGIKHGEGERSRVRGRLLQPHG